MDTNAIHQALAPLIGLPLHSIGRAANMLWLEFGQMREVATRGGGTKSVGEYAIHIQCAWRLCRRGRIEVADHDFYYDPQGNTLDDDWDLPRKSQFDQMAHILNSEFEDTSICVLSAIVDDVGGFSLHLADELRLDVFPDSSCIDEHSEHWRLFRPGADEEHFVIP